MIEDFGKEIFCNFGEDGEILEGPTMLKKIGNVFLTVPAGEAVKTGEASGDRWEEVIEAMERAVTEKGSTSGGKV